MRRVFTFLVALALLGMTAPVVADVPTEMSVQGRLTNGAGAPVPAGLKNFTFKIWDAPAGGTEIWPAGPGELQTLTTDANGLWNAGVGQIIPLTEVVFLSPVRWLEVTVDDGVNPIETLPRIELRTNPYTYRSATSQNADSLAGSTLSDLTDQFVDEPGDVMTGSLGFSNGTYPMTYVYQSGTLNAERSVISHSSTFPNWGLFYEDIGDIWHFKMGGTDIVSVDDVRLTVEGGTWPTTITSFVSGDASVQLPDDAVSSLELLNEPGLSNSVNPTFFFAGASGTVYVVDSVEITTPTSGYVEVEAHLGWINVFHTTGTSTEVWCSVSKIRASTALDDGAQVIGIPAAIPTSGDHRIPLQASRVFSESAGLQKYYLNMNYTFGADASLSIGRPYIRARFYPTLYGTVTFSESSISPGSSDAADRTETSRPGAGSTQDITVEDDRAALAAELAALRARVQALESSVTQTTGSAGGE